MSIHQNFNAAGYGEPIVAIFDKRIFQFRGYFSSIQRGSIQRINFGSIRYIFGSTSDFAFNTFAFNTL